MNQLSKSSFPEYGRAHLTEDCRAHLLGAASCWNAAHTALLVDDKRTALIEIDKAIAIAHEARKFLLAPKCVGTNPASTDTASQEQP